jgi:hypothetical protein
MFSEVRAERDTTHCGNRFNPDPAIFIDANFTPSIRDATAALNGTAEVPSTGEPKYSSQVKAGVGKGFAAKELGLRRIQSLGAAVSTHSLEH